MSKMTARQRAALACLRVNHPRAEVSVLWHALDRRPLQVKVRMRWPGRYTRIVWLTPSGGLELGETHIRDRQLARA
jgi:hypothetical protein